MLKLTCFWWLTTRIVCSLWLLTTRSRARALQCVCVCVYKCLARACVIGEKRRSGRKSKRLRTISYFILLSNSFHYKKAVRHWVALLCQFRTFCLALYFPVATFGRIYENPCRPYDAHNRCLHIRSQWRRQSTRYCLNGLKHKFKTRQFSVDKQKLHVTKGTASQNLEALT